MEHTKPKKDNNDSIMKEDIAIEMESLKQTQNEHCPQPILDIAETSKQSGKDAYVPNEVQSLLKALDDELTPLISQENNKTSTMEQSPTKISENDQYDLNLNEQIDKKEVTTEQMKWMFANKEMERNYNVSSNFSTIEFIAEEKKNCLGSVKDTKESSVLQLSKPLPNGCDQISFMMKIVDLGKNIVGNGNNGIEIGFSRKISHEESKYLRRKRMEMGLWYDPYNGAIYHNKRSQEELINRAEKNDVIEWRVQDTKEDDGNVITRATLFINNQEFGQPYILDRSVPIYPSIYIGSTEAKVTIDTSGMCYIPTLIEYHDNTDEPDADDCFSKISCCVPEQCWKHLKGFCGKIKGCVFLNSKCGFLTWILAHSMLFMAIYQLFKTCWMLGDMTTDSITTVEYYKYWKNVSGTIESMNTSMINETKAANISINCTDPTIICPSNFASNYSWIFFFSAIIIWTLTPLVRTLMIYNILWNMMFKWEKYNLDYTTNDQQIVIKLLHIFGLTQEKVHLFPTYLKLLVMFVPPLGIATFAIVMFYAAFLCYVQFPLYAIRVALENIYKELLERSRAKVDKVFGKHETILTIISKGKNFCGLGILNEDDISSYKMIEAIYESAFQYGLSLFYFNLTQKYDLEGNYIERNLYSQKNSIVLVSMIMSLGTILIAIFEFSVNQLRIEYGRDFYARLCLMSHSNRFDVALTFLILPITMIFILILSFLEFDHIKPLDNSLI